jgi:hypothetical protein
MHVSGVASAAAGLPPREFGLDPLVALDDLDVLSVAGHLVEALERLPSCLQQAARDAEVGAVVLVGSLFRLGGLPAEVLVELPRLVPAPVGGDEGDEGGQLPRGTGENYLWCVRGAARLVGWTRARAARDVE